MTPPFRLGAPGIYRQPLQVRPRLDLPRMDVAASVGVSPRGPVREPKLDETWTFDRPCVDPARARRRSLAVAVESFQEYRRLFGGFEGPGRLPFAVASFFEQGGQRAYVVRIVHDYGKRDRNAAGVAQGLLTGVRTPLRIHEISTVDLVVDVTELPRQSTVGTLIRLTMPDGLRVNRTLRMTADADGTVLLEE